MNCCNTTYYPFYPRSCDGNIPLYRQPCKPAVPYVSSNFITPVANADVIIELTDTSMLYAGEGVLIGATYYQITGILDSTHVTARHNGLGAAVSTTVYAIQPANGCYQYPVISVGLVNLQTVVALTGIHIDGMTSNPPDILSYSNNTLLYGYVGPTTVLFSTEITLTTTNAPTYIGLIMPFSMRTTSPFGVFSAYIKEGSNEPVISVARQGEDVYSNYILVGKSGDGLINDGTSVISVSGKCEIQI